MSDEEIVQLPGSMMDLIYQQDKAFIDMQIATAKAYPRSIKKCVENILDMVTLDFDTADSCSYTLKRDGKPIIGPSVNLAKIIVQQWTNVRAESRIVETTATQVTAEAVCFDLETNVAIKVQVRRSIVGKKGRYSDDMITVTGNAACSIGLRNAIFAVIPTNVRDKAHRAAIETVTGDLSTPEKLEARRKYVLDGFATSYGVTEAEVLASIGKETADKINAEDITFLLGMARAIKDGELTVETLFRPVKDTPKQPTAQERERDRLLDWIDRAKSIEDLEKLRGHITPETSTQFEEKLKTFPKPKKSKSDEKKV